MSPRTGASLLAVMLLAATACTGGSSDDDGPTATVGSVLPAQLLDQVQGRHSYVVVPGLRYDLTLSRPTDRIDSITAREEGVDDDGGDDVRFVGITWELDSQLGDSFAMRPKPDEPAVLTLLVDGRPTEVGDLGAEGFFGAYVAVPEDADEIGYTVTYDGLVQTVPDAYDLIDLRGDGPGALYHEAPQVHWSFCPETRLSAGDARVSFFGTDCSARISSRLPYYGPLGWAPAGSAWVVADVYADATLVGLDLGDDYVDYEPSSTVRLTYDGREPVELLPVEDADRAGEQEDGSWSATAVFQVHDTGSDRPLTFVRRYVATPEDDDVPAIAPDEIRRTQRVELS